MLLLETLLRGGELCEERGALLFQCAQLGQIRERVLPSAAAGAVGSGSRCRSSLSHRLSLSRSRCSLQAPVLSFSFPIAFAFGGGSHCGQLLVQVRDCVLVSIRKRTLRQTVQIIGSRARINRILRLFVYVNSQYALSIDDGIGNRIRVLLANDCLSRGFAAAIARSAR